MTLHKAVLEDKGRNQFLVRLRAKHKWSIRVMAVKLGVNYNTLSMVELGKRPMNMLIIRAALNGGWISEAEAKREARLVAEDRLATGAKL